VITLDEHQFEILPTELSAAGVGFGIGLNVSVDDDGWDTGDAEWIVQDTVNQVRGSRNFGRDALSGPTWTFALHVNRTDTVEALSSLEELRTAWMAKDVIETPGRMSVLRYRVGDRVRRTYGRPRKWAAPPSNRILGGYVPITATFDNVDHLLYDDNLDTTTIPFVATSEGGFIFPVTFPVETLPAGQREGSIYVGGTVPTYPVIRFNGPITNPYLQCGSQWRVQLNMAIAVDQYVEIDTRPWKLSILRQGLHSEAGKLSRRTWLKDVILRPGPQELALGGTSAEGTGSATVSWRSAYASI
jgi:hypothetical protein